MLIKFPLTIRRERFLYFVKIAHGKQLRKYTNIPYWNHCISVANSLYFHTKNDSIDLECALGHDLFEDTSIDAAFLKKYLIDLKYNIYEADYIIAGITALTDVYTKSFSPTLNRKSRKEFEAHRLSNISPNFQNIKYCDMLDNITTIIKYDPKFAEVYIPELELKTKLMSAGDMKLRKTLLKIIEKSKYKLKYGFFWFIYYFFKKSIKNGK